LAHGLLLVHFYPFNFLKELRQISFFGKKERSGYDKITQKLKDEFLTLNMGLP